MEFERVVYEINFMSDNRSLKIPIFNCENKKQVENQLREFVEFTRTKAL
ncbi:MAG: hypothetical protein ACJAZ3_001269 [Sphingobacteriales bacterium]|jgi:hypothetical protein